MIRLELIAVFFLILGRILGVFLQAPILNSRSFPVFAKTALAIWITIVLLFVTPITTSIPATFLAFILALIFEVAVGFTIGFVCNIIFLAIQAAGEIIDMQMGLSVATALDPTFGAVISVVGRITFFLTMIIFLAVNGHHLVLSALHQSFTVLPAGKMANFAAPNLIILLISLGSHLWLTAIKLSAPIVLLIFISDFTFGIVSRIAPQVNVFMLGFQVKPSLGLFGISLTLPFIVQYIIKTIEYMAEQLIILVNVIK